MSEATSGHETERGEVKFNESDTRVATSTYRLLRAPMLNQPRLFGRFGWSPKCPDEGRSL